MAVNSINSTSYPTTQISSTNNALGSKEVFKQGYILLNGKKVRVGASMKETAHNLNKRSAQTGVKAGIKKNDRGNEILVLTSSRKTVNISDPTNVFSGLFKNNQLTKQGNKLIQIVGHKSIGNRIKINYSHQQAATKQIQSLKLSEALIVDLSRISNNAALMQAPIIEEEQLPAVENMQFVPPLVAPQLTPIEEMQPPAGAVNDLPDEVEKNLLNEKEEALPMKPIEAQEDIYVEDAIDQPAAIEEFPPAAEDNSWSGWAWNGAVSSYNYAKDVYNAEGGLYGKRDKVLNDATEYLVDMVI